MQAGPYFKIGLSQTPKKRLKAVRRALLLPYPVEMVHEIEAPDMYTAEQHLHHRFADFRMNGEWFRLPDWAVRYIRLIWALDAVGWAGCFQIQCPVCSLYEVRHDPLFEFEDEWVVEDTGTLIDLMQAQGESLL